MNIKELNIIHYNIMSILQDEEKGWWSGYDNIRNVLFNRLNIHFTKRQIKATLTDLKSVGYVYTDPIFDDEMKLNGQGWFCKWEHKNTIFNILKTNEK